MDSVESGIIFFNAVTIFSQMACELMEQVKWMDMILPVDANSWQALHLIVKEYDSDLCWSLKFTSSLC